MPMYCLLSLPRSNWLNNMAKSFRPKKQQQQNCVVKLNIATRCRIVYKLWKQQHSLPHSLFFHINEDSPRPFSRNSRKGKFNTGRAIYWQQVKLYRSHSLNQLPFLMDHCFPHLSVFLSNLEQALSWHSCWFVICKIAHTLEVIWAAEIWPRMRVMMV